MIKSSKHKNKRYMKKIIVLCPNIVEYMFKTSSVLGGF